MCSVPIGYNPSLVGNQIGNCRYCHINDFKHIVKLYDVCPTDVENYSLVRDNLW